MSRQPSAIRYPLFAILLLGFFLRVHDLGAQSLWLDEAYTWGIVTRTTWSDVWSAMLAVSDVSPLYYVLAKMVTPLWGASEFGLRILGALFGWLAIAATYRLGRAMFEDRVGVLAAAILALSPFAIWYSQDARPYGLYLWLAALTLWGLHRAERGRGWKMFIAASALLYLTHYVAALFAYVQAVYALTRLRARPKLFRQWFAAQVVAVLLVGAWVIAFLLQRRPLTANNWIPAVTWLSPLQTLWNFVSGDAVQWTPIMVIGLIALIILLMIGARTFSVAAQLLMGWLVLPILIGWAFSFRLPSYIDRFFEPALLSIALLLACGVMALSSPRVRVVIIALTVIALLYASTRLFFDPTFTKEDWRGAAKKIESLHLPVAVSDPESPLALSPYISPTYTFARDGWELSDLVGKTPFVFVLRSPFDSAHALSKSTPFDPLKDGDPFFRQWVKENPSLSIQVHRFTGLALVEVRK